MVGSRDRLYSSNQKKKLMHLYTGITKDNSAVDLLARSLVSEQEAAIHCAKDLVVEVTNGEATTRTLVIGIQR